MRPPVSADADDDAGRPLYLLMVYAKAQREDMTADEKRAVRSLAAVLKGRG